MTEREMLELAAKAAGQERSAAGDLWSNARGQLWDPLGDDGDALRLAVGLGINVLPGRGYAAWTRAISLTAYADERPNVDRCAAARRTIVRVAAEIGKQMGGGDVG